MARKEESSISKKPQPSLLSLLAAVAILSGVAGGAGWYLGSNYLQHNSPSVKNSTSAPDANPDEEVKSEKGENKDEMPEEDLVEGTNKSKLEVIKLDPIIVALRGSSGTWLRLELSIVAQRIAGLNQAPKITEMSNDITAFLRTISLRQVSGPSGYLHLREDLLDRARLVSQGQAKDILITTMVFE